MSISNNPQTRRADGLGRYDLDYGHLFNYSARPRVRCRAQRSIPILAIDLYGHAYFYDSDNKTAYIEALLQISRGKKCGCGTNAPGAIKAGGGNESVRFGVHALACSEVRVQKIKRASMQLLSTPFFANTLKA